MPVTLDIIAEQPRGTDEQGRLTQLSRFVDVTGLTAGPNTLPSALTVSGVPEDGDAHPNNADLYVARRLPRLTADRTRVRIEIVYEFREQVEPEAVVSVSERMIQGGSSLRNVRTQKDVNGEQIKVRKMKVEEGATGDKLNEGGYVDKLEPQSTLVVQFDEPHAFPPEVERLWTGKVNETKWLDDQPHTWLCTAVDYDIKDDNTSPKVWTWRFEFQYAPPIRTLDDDVSGWIATVVATDERGKPMVGPDPSLGIGQIKDVVLYKELDFNDKFTK